MKSLFRKITPVSVLVPLSIILLAVQFFIPGNDYNIFAYLFIYIVVLGLVLLIDRFLVSKITYKKLLISEILVILCVGFWYIYSTGYAEVKIETTKPYFFIVYDNGGFRKSDMPSSGLFKTSIRLNADSAVRLNYSLRDETVIDPPASWNYSYLTKLRDTVINFIKIEIQIYTLNLSPDTVDSLLEAAVVNYMVGIQKADGQ